MSVVVVFLPMSSAKREPVSSGAEPAFCDVVVMLRKLTTDEAVALKQRGDTCGPRTCKGVKHDAARRDNPHDLSHDLRRFARHVVLVVLLDSFANDTRKATDAALNSKGSSAAPDDVLGLRPESPLLRACGLCFVPGNNAAPDPAARLQQVAGFR